MKSFATLAGIALTLAATPALANRTFVSGKGADSGTCAVTAPCRSFAYALTQTTVSGEVVVLDSAGYGPLSITQAVSISNPDGIEAGVSVPSGGIGITINAPGARVDLRGLTVDGQGVGATGIAIVAAQHVNIVHAVVRNLTTTGIAVNAGQALISNAFISNAVIGVSITSTLCCSLVDGSTVTDNSSYGISVSGASSNSLNTSSSQVRNTSITNNASGISNFAANLMLSNVNCYGNSSVDIDNEGGVVDLNFSTIGTSKNGFYIESYGNNSVSGSIPGTVQQRPLR